jgi:MYXO-CTERM domain-containing protein
VTVLENQGTASIELNRVDGNSESISVDYALASANDDLELASGTLTWDANNAAPQSIELTIVDDALSEDNETYQLILTANDESVLGTTTTLEIIIRDDESNLAPSIDLVAEESFQADEFATITAEGSDPEGDTLSWQWTQLSGPTITLVSADTATVEFTMPSGDIVLQATANDDFGVTTSSEVSVEQAAATPPAPTPVTPPQSETNGGSSSGGSLPLGALLLGGLLVWLRRQEKQN